MVAGFSGCAVEIDEDDVDAFIEIKKPKGYRFWFGSEGTGDGQFREPHGMAVDSSGNIYVADTGNHRIQVFDTKGRFIRQFGSRGSGNGQFDEPYGVAVDSSGNIYSAIHNICNIA